jgi:uncharacterized protein Yka (UPF0111/DUF47 family)
MDKRIYKIGQLTLKIAENSELWRNSKERGYKYLQQINRAEKKIDRLVAEIRTGNGENI